MSRRLALALAACLGCPALAGLVLLMAMAWPALAGAQAAGGAAADTTVADSLAFEAATPDTVTFAPGIGLPGELPPSIAAPEIPLLLSWLRLPKAGLEADMRRVRYFGELGSTMLLDREASFTQSVKAATENHRQFDKTVDTRGGSLEFKDGKSLPIDATLNMSWDWSEDRTVNTAGALNLIRRDYKRANLEVARTDVRTGPVLHDLALNGDLEDQQGQTFLQRTDYSDARLGGGIRSRIQPLSWLFLRTVAFERRSDGERVLGEQTSPSSAVEDTLGGKLRYGSLGEAKGGLKGSFSVFRASFEKRYLDWRRNTTGLVDTARTSAAEKIVDELEHTDALSLDWQNELNLGPLGCSVSLQRQVDESSFRASGAGTTERQRDLASSSVWFKGPRDTLEASFGREQRWDDQTIRGSATARGRQIHDQYDLGLGAAHRLFARTSVRVGYDERLSQDTAAGGFNNNDRDRLEQIGTARLSCKLSAPFTTELIFSARHIEDVSLDESRSGNNNAKDIYELAPFYRWQVSPLIEVRQTYRLAIEYTDYLYSELASVTREDDYNKRGNLSTRVTLWPSDRLRLVVQHDYSERFNATREETDATGTDFYRRDLEQTVNTIDFALEFQANEWLKLRGATDRTRDEKNTLGRAGIQEQRSGEVVVGLDAKRKWQQDRLVLDVQLSSFFAYGPNVQDVNERYWEADASLSWSF